MTQAADKLAEKAVPVTEKATTKIQEKAAQVGIRNCCPAGLRIQG